MKKGVLILVLSLFIFGFISFVSASSWDVVKDLKTLDSNIQDVVEMKSMGNYLYVLSDYYPTNRGGQDPIKIMVSEYDGTNWRELPLVFDVPAGGMIMPLGMEVVNDKLYVAAFNTTHPAASTLLYSYNRGDNKWVNVKISPDGTFGSINTVWTPPILNNLIKFNNNLYVLGNWQIPYSSNYSKFKIYNPSTSSWTTTPKYAGFADDYVTAVTSDSYNNLYVITTDVNGAGGKVYKSSNLGNGWSQIGDLGANAGYGNNYGMFVSFKGNLYLGRGTGSPLLRYDGASWQSVSPLINNVIELESSANKLFIVYSNSENSLFMQEYDGTNVINSSCGNAVGIRKLESYNGQMYASTGGSRNPSSINILRYNATSACDTLVIQPPQNPVTCTNFSYSSWGACVNNVQSRNSVGFPDGCTGGNPVLTQSCNPNTQVNCTSFTYSNWSECLNGAQGRTATGTPAGCSGGNPVLTQSCTPINPPIQIINCTDSDGGLDYFVNGSVTNSAGGSNSDFCGPIGAVQFTTLHEYFCNSSNSVSGFDVAVYNCSNGCSNGACNVPVGQVECTSFTYSNWSECLNGAQGRTATGTPAGCIGGNPAELMRGCTLGSQGDANCSLGCFSADRCVPFGYRVNGNYCDVDNALRAQKISNATYSPECNNNFECKSNVCVNDKCVSMSLIERIIAWFTSFFSGN